MDLENDAGVDGSDLVHSEGEEVHGRERLCFLLVERGSV